MIILTSIGLSNQKVADFIRRQHLVTRNQSLAIITTAACNKSRNQYCRLATKQFQDLGFIKVDYFDLEKQPVDKLDSYQLIYVAGGNTFKLMKVARQVNLGRAIQKLLSRNGIYIGVSAGSIILGPSISIAEDILHDKKDVKTLDFTGLNVVPFVALPHYSVSDDDKVTQFKNRHRYQLEKIADNAAIIVHKGKIRRI